MLNSELANQIGKAAPPLVVSGGYFLGISWSDWVLIVTFVYTLLQIGDWIYNKVKAWRNRNVSS